MNVARRVIGKCGGPRRVAEWLGISVVSVYRMTYPKRRGGTGGLIPARHQAALLRRAAREGVDLAPADFFDRVAAAQGAGPSRLERLRAIRKRSARIKRRDDRPMDAIIGYDRFGMFR
jgi:hypothetical protein